jgi:hypothetical protein
MVPHCGSIHSKAGKSVPRNAGLGGAQLSMAKQSRRRAVRCGGVTHSKAGEATRGAAMHREDGQSKAGETARGADLRRRVTQSKRSGRLPGRSNRFLKLTVKTNLCIVDLSQFHVEVDLHNDRKSDIFFKRLLGRILWTFLSHRILGLLQGDSPQHRAAFFLIARAIDSTALPVSRRGAESIAGREKDCARMANITGACTTAAVVISAAGNAGETPATMGLGSSVERTGL